MSADLNPPKAGLPNGCVNTDRDLWCCRDRNDLVIVRVFLTEGDGIGIEYAGNVIVMPARMWHDAVLGQSTKEHCLRIVDHRLQRSIDPGIRYALKCVAEDIRALKHPTQEQEAGSE